MKSRVKILGLIQMSKDSNLNDEIKSNLAKLICVQISGYLECYIEGIIVEFAGKKGCHSCINSHLVASLKKFQNPSPSKINELLKLFSDSWSEDFNAYIKIKGRREALEAIVSNRNKIAHGEDSTVTIHALEAYEILANECVEYLSGIINNTK